MRAAMSLNSLKTTAKPVWVSNAAEADVGSVVVHLGGAGVANEMAPVGAVDTGFLDEPGENAAEPNAPEVEPMKQPIRLNC